MGIISKLITTQGIRTIKAIIIGSKIVQQKDINWSKRILGNDALVQININIITQDLIPIANPDNIPSINDLSFWEYKFVAVSYGIYVGKEKSPWHML